MHSPHFPGMKGRAEGLFSRSNIIVNKIEMAGTFPSTRVLGIYFGVVNLWSSPLLEINEY